MPLPSDVKRLNYTNDGYQQPLDVNADSAAALGFYPQNSSSTDKNAGVTRDSSGNLVLTDALAGSKTLTQLVDAGLQFFTESESTAAPNDTVPVDAFTAAYAGGANADVVLAAKGTGATLAQIPNNGLSGGNKRGTYAVDWQRTRTNAAMVAAGGSSVVAGGANNTALYQGCVVGGGGENTAAGIFAAIAGGRNNNAAHTYTTIAGGQNNTVSAAHSAIGGGIGHTVSSQLATIAGGNLNTIGASADGATIAGGSQNQANAPISTVAGGSTNVVESTAATVSYSFIGGGQGNTIQSSSNSTTHAVIGGGQNNIARRPHAAVLSGTTNTAAQTAAVVGGGGNNQALGVSSAVFGGSTNVINSTLSFIGGGLSNSMTVNCGYGVIAGGSGNTLNAAGNYCTIGGGQSNTISGSTAVVNAFIGGGNSNTVNVQYGTVAGGFNNRVQGTAERGFVGGGGFNIASASGACIAGGNSNQASGENTFIGGGYGNQASAQYAAAIAGYYNFATSYCEMSLGLYSHDFVGASKTAWVATDPLFKVGNGTSLGASNQSNAITVLKNAKTAIGKGQSKPDEMLDVGGTVEFAGALSQFGFTAGEAVSAGDVLYINADGKAYKALADIADPTKAVVVGVATRAAASSAAVSASLLGFRGGYSGLTAGTAYYLSNATAGGVVTYSALGSGSRAILIGHAVSVTTILVRIQDFGVKP